MNNRTFYINGSKYRRITKAAAKKAYNAGEVVRVAACNVDISNKYYNFSCDIEKANNAGCTFDNVINAFEYYNCNTCELGKYAAFYIMEV